MYPQRRRGGGGGWRFWRGLGLGLGFGERVPAISAKGGGADPGPARSGARQEDPTAPRERKISRTLDFCFLMYLRRNRGFF